MEIDIMFNLDNLVHGIGHIEGVVSNTILLLEQLPSADKEVCILSAYWHDVGRVFGKKGHPLTGAKILKEELGRRCFQDEFIMKCYKTIYRHGGKELPDTIRRNYSS